MRHKRKQIIARQLVARGFRKNYFRKINKKMELEFRANPVSEIGRIDSFSIIFS